MTKIDLLSIEPHQVSRDLKGKIVCLYGEAKCGKTTTASKFPKSLLVAFEKGFNALSGVKVQPVTRWGDFRKVLRELSKPEVQEVFDTIIIDTVDLAYDAAEKFICAREGVDQIGDIPYGAGYKMLRNEFNDALRSIPMMDYGLVNISHSMSVNITDESGNEHSKTMPTLPRAARHIVLSMSDIIGYAKPVEHNGERRTALFLRGTPQFEAGSRFKYTPDVIPFEYEALVDAIADAIEKEASEDSEAVTDKVTNIYEEEERKSFDELNEEIKKILSSLMEGKDDEEKAPIAEQVTKIIETHLGKSKMLKNTTEEQRDHVELILLDLQDYQASQQ